MHLISLDWIYWAISWILLTWHSLWDLILPAGQVIGTNFAWVLAIVFLVITVRVILFPLFVKQIKSQRAMQALQPRVKELQEKHKGDRESMQKELMELYRTEKANPLMGCLPLVLQIPVFLGLFHVLRRLDPDKSEAAKTLYGWTIGQFDSASGAHLLGAPIAAKFGSTASELAALDASAMNVKIVAAVLVAMMIITTYLTQRQMISRTGWATDPQQKMIQRLMLYGVPLSLLVSGSLFPIGVVIYWVTTNLFSMGQQFWVLRKYPPPVNSAAGAGKSAPAGRAPGKGKTDKDAGKGAASPNGASTTDGKALAPRPGAKPTTTKKTGTRKKTRR